MKDLNSDIKWWISIHYVDRLKKKEHIALSSDIGKDFITLNIFDKKYKIYHWKISLIFIKYLSIILSEAHS